MAFSRDRNSRSGGDRGGFRSRPSFGDRPRFNDRNDRGPVEMHDATCDNCGKACQVPFRPTSGKPVYCSNCFEQQKGRYDEREARSEGSPRFANDGGRGSERSEERQMFSAVCADCGDDCKVPFRPSSDKPIFCSNCFGDKKHAGGSTGGGKDKFEELNAKLDKILSLLSPEVKAKVTAEEAVVQEKVEKPAKVAKKKTKVKEEITPVTEE